MSQWTNTTPPVPVSGTTYTQNPAIIAGGSGLESCFLFCPTARLAQTSPSVAGTVFEQATRTATSCYMKGYKDSIELQVTDGLPWQWRRIVFTVKGLVPALGQVPGQYETDVLTSNGQTRVVNQVPGTGSTGSRNILYGVVFKGSLGNDWTDPLIAPVDRTRVTILSDAIKTISSGNEDGCIRKYTRYIKMEKTLVYNDDEIGGEESESRYSVLGKQGMGDCYILDIFRPRTGSATSNQLSLSITGTLYWHER